MMEKEKEELFGKFEENIHKYCDNKIGEKILFTGFEFMWPRNSTQKLPNRQELSELTGKIIGNLICRKVLKEVEKEEGYESVYGLYEIQAHAPLIKYSKNR